MTRVEKLRAMAEVTRARTRMEALDVEVKAHVAEGMETLREEGEYMEYAPGERYQTEPGVYSAAEPAEGGGVRMFYLFPEDFPDIYAKKQERLKIAEESAQRLLAMLAE